MATQPVSLPDRLTIAEDTLDQLQQMAERQHISVSQALTRAIQMSDYIYSNMEDPQTKVLLKRGKNYTQLVASR